MELEGKIITKFPEQGGVSKAGKNWRKQEYLLETFGTYPRKVVFNFFNDRIDQNRMEPGRCYSVSIEIESREFNGRWYTDVRGFSSREISQPNPADNGGFQPGNQGAFQTTAEPQAPFNPQAPSFGGNDSDDLPF